MTIRSRWMPWRQAGERRDATGVTTGTMPATADQEQENYQHHQHQSNDPEELHPPGRAAGRLSAALVTARRAPAVRLAPRQVGHLVSSSRKQIAGVVYET
jgi:hypothetical protein